jgi:hypothetical protein
MIVGTHYQRAGAGFALALLALFQPGVAWSQGTERLPAGADPAEIGEAVLFVHGAT